MGTPRIAGHRGLPRAFPDNTLAGILAAQRVCDMVEIDVRRTADEFLVLSHEPVLEGKVIVETPWAELANIDLGGGQPPVLLDTVLAEVNDLPLDIEIKNSPQDPDFDATYWVAHQVASRARSQDVVTSFHWPTVDAVRDAAPEVATGLLVDPHRSLEAAAAAAVAAGHGTVAPHWSLLQDRAHDRVEALAGRGLHVVVWTVNDPAIAVALAGAGVAVLITDDPAGIRRAVEEAA